MDINKTIEDSRTALATAIGVAPGIVEVMKGNWATFMKAGLLVKLSVGRWRGKAQLEMHHLGLSGESHTKLIELGKIHLFPTIQPSSQFYDEKKPERTYAQLLGSIEANARNAIETAASATPWGAWVQAEQLRDLLPTLEERKQTYFAIRDEIAERWEEITDTLLEEYRIEAQNAWLRAQKLNPGQMRERQWEELDQYTAEFLAGIIRTLPSQKEFAQSFYFDYELNYIPLPDLLAQEEAVAADIQRSQVIADAEMRTELSKLEAERSANLTAAQMRERQLREMNTLVVEKAKEQKERMLAEFIDATAGQLRRTVIEIAQNVQVSIKKNGGDRLLGKSAQQLSNLLETIDKARFAEDTELDEILAPCGLFSTKAPTTAISPASPAYSRTSSLQPRLHF